MRRPTIQQGRSPKPSKWPRTIIKRSTMSAIMLFWIAMAGESFISKGLTRTISRTIRTKRHAITTIRSFSDWTWMIRGFKRYPSNKIMFGMDRPPQTGRPIPRDRHINSTLLSCAPTLVAPVTRSGFQRQIWRRVDQELRRPFQPPQPRHGTSHGRIPCPLFRWQERDGYPRIEQVP